MPYRKSVSGLSIIIFIFLFSGCGPKSVVTDPIMINENSKEWVPYSGNDQIKFFMDEDSMVFAGGGVSNYYERVRYMTDQSGFFTVQKDYYADLERQEMVFTCPSSNYYLKLLLEKGKGESGEWDILHISMADGDYYSNKIKIVTYQTDSYDKGEVYQYKDKVILNGNQYREVYYVTQDRRPFELYYNKDRGIIAFKVTSSEIWTIDTDKMN